MTRNPLRIGDNVRTPAPYWDGTVVDVIDDDLVRVYWRYPLGKVTDHHVGELVRKV